MDVKKHEAAVFVRRLIRHPEFNSIAKRFGKVIILSHTNIAVWALNAHQKEYVGWIDKMKFSK